MYTEIKKCRICESVNLNAMLSLGEQYLTGVFPKSPEESLSKGPLDLVWCSNCSLLQMKQSYSLDEMYGENYGYRSGLNASMVRHLQQKIYFLELLVKPSRSDLVIDIGSNDATSLKAYSGTYRKVGIDPTGKKFKEYYTDDISLIPDFFSAKVFQEQFPGEKARIITSIAMFYDLETPVAFVQDIEAVLADDGVWHFEQSYMPSMLRTNSYDTICHEHLEFYSFKVVKNMLESCGLRIIDVQMNAINGGSFGVTACKKNASYRSNLPIINWLLQQEEDIGLDTPKPYRDFEERVFSHRKHLRTLVEALVEDGKKIIGYGASTKGNVLLQFCGLTIEHIPYIAEVNPDKYGSFTPGTNIPIISEKEARAMQPHAFQNIERSSADRVVVIKQHGMTRGGICGKAKVFLSGSAMQFENKGQPIDEQTPFEASSPYSVARIHSTYAGRYYRRAFGAQVYVGYFFNHDSPLRTERHVNKKITNAVKRIAGGSAETLELGNIDVRKEFNYAGDVVEAVWRLVNQKGVYEAVIGSGKPFSIRDWLEYCFNRVGLNWQNHVVLKGDFVPEYEILVSNPALIKSLGWQPRVDFYQLVDMMMDEE